MMGNFRITMVRDNKGRFIKGNISWTKINGNPKLKGQNHHHWKGKKAGYRAIHYWLEGEYGIPEKCEKCSISKIYGTDGRRLIHWANISGEYKRDFDDWMSLCVSCHKIYDLNRKEVKLNASIRL